MLAIRLDTDTEWLLAPDSTRPRALQLLLVGVAAPAAQPFSKPDFRSGQGRERSGFVEQVQAAGREITDDPRVCPAEIPGQLTVFQMRRRLTAEAAYGIVDRPVDGMDRVLEELAGYADENGYSPSWRRQVREMIRLTLAVRDADGQTLVAPQVIDDLPAYGVQVSEVLRRANLLGRRTGNPVHREAGSGRHWLPKRPGSCPDCGAWSVGRCQGCQQWRLNREGKDPVGDCTRCHRTGLPLMGTLCRGCSVHLAALGPSAADEPFTQLWFGGQLAEALRILDGRLGYRPTGRRGRDLAVRLPAERELSPHLVDPAQLILFDMARDWTEIAASRVDELPLLTDDAQVLVNEFDELMIDQQWEWRRRKDAVRCLQKLFGWLGSDARLLERDVRALSAASLSISAKRTVQLLERRGLVADPARRADSDELAVERLLRALPQGIGDELRVWAAAARGQGRWRHEGLSFRTIRAHLHKARPVLEEWATTLGSLREVESEHVRAALRIRPGIMQGQHLAGALRSIFRGLQHERVIFQNPMRGLVFSKVVRLPASLSSDRLQGLVEAAATPLDKVIIALVAIHALSGHDIRHLKESSLDLSRGRLQVCRTAPHTVFLDETTHHLLEQWIR
ncbi:hypothetical protein ASE03_12215 [Kitasatospora sp. Root187]|uniref:hypothetical protein n=2 Tax=unclassified Kitasatospora TaxID=2633591 RepID=UPI00070A1529|nr:hypothetical protein [Kitasatospora sp. Root187]KRB60374.1 hypothetical protein ASE03_12215 [Kitasatospora sp. Root187]